MKKIIYTLLLFFSVSTYAQFKNFKIQYEVKATKSTKHNPNIENFILYYTPQKSLFINQNRVISSHLFSAYISKIKTAAKIKSVNENSDVVEIKMDASAPEMQEINKYKYKNKWVIEKDFKNRSLTLQDKAFMSVIKYTQPLPSFQWKLQDSTKEILGFKLNQAKLHYKGRNYTAWYSPEIQIPDGPYKFWGLPGLIMEIYDDKDEYHFLIKGIEEMKEEFPKDYFIMKSGLIPLIITTEAKFRKDFERTYNINNVLGNAVIIGQDRDEYARERIEKIKQKYNNPIERENK